MFIQERAVDQTWWLVQEVQIGSHLRRRCMHETVFTATATARRAGFLPDGVIIMVLLDCYLC